MNDPGTAWWLEVWNGLYWQSANEFTDRYDSVLFTNSGRFGIRKTGNTALSRITPYLFLQSQLSKYRRTGTRQCIFVPDSNSRDPQNLLGEPPANRGRPAFRAILEEA